MMLWSFVGKTEKGPSFFVHKRPPLNHFNEATCVVPDDVREGYLLSLQPRVKKPKDSLLSLEQAEEEFGFRQKGDLAIPYQPQELEKILDGQIE